MHLDPYATLVTRVREGLASARLLVVIGYSFRDHHIKSVVLEQMRANRSLYALIVDPSASTILSESDLLLTAPHRFADVSDRLVPWSLTARDGLSGHQLRDRVNEVFGVAEMVDRIDDARRARTSGEVTDAIGQMLEVAGRIGWMRPIGSAAGAQDGELAAASQKLAEDRVSGPWHFLACWLLIGSPNERVRYPAAAAVARHARQLLKRTQYVADGRRVAIDPRGPAPEREPTIREIERHVAFLRQARRDGGFHLTAPALLSIDALIDVLTGVSSLLQREHEEATGEIGPGVVDEQRQRLGASLLHSGLHEILETHRPT